MNRLFIDKHPQRKKKERTINNLFNINTYRFFIWWYVVRSVSFVVFFLPFFRRWWWNWVLIYFFVFPFSFQNLWQWEKMRRRKRRSLLYPKRKWKNKTVFSSCYLPYLRFRYSICVPLRVSVSVCVCGCECMCEGVCVCVCSF